MRGMDVQGPSEGDGRAGGRVREMDVQGAE